MFPGRIFYLGLLVTGLANLALLWLTRTSINPDTITPALAPAALAGILGLVARYFRTTPAFSKHADRIITLCEGLFFTLTAIVFLPLLNHLTSRIPLPYTDAPLIRADGFFILQWKSYFIFALEHRAFLQILFGAYALLSALSLGFLLSLLASGRTLRAEFYIAGYFLTALISIIIGTFFPTKGPFISLMAAQVPKELMGDLVFNAYHVAYLERLREAAPFVINLNDMPGLTCFPSFHTAAAIVFAWSSRNTKFFRAFLIYAIVMVSSTPVVGGHYFTDLAGGAAVAVVTLLCLQRLKRYRILFERENTAS